MQLVVTDVPQQTPPAEIGGERRRHLSFAGLMHAEPDLAARSEEILHEELGE